MQANHPAVKATITAVNDLASVFTETASALEEIRAQIADDMAQRQLMVDLMLAVQAERDEALAQLADATAERDQAQRQLAETQSELEALRASSKEDLSAALRRASALQNAADGQLQAALTEVRRLEAERFNGNK